MPPSDLMETTEILRAENYRRALPDGLVGKLKSHPYLQGFYAHYDGRIFSRVDRRRLSDWDRLVEILPYTIKHTECVGLSPDPIENPGIPQRSVPVARFVLECWVGVALGRTACRFPPFDNEWAFPHAAENLYWSEPRVTDDLGVYKTGRMHNWQRTIIFPWTHGEYRTLKAEYEKIRHPQLTEQNQPPMMPVPG